MGDSPPDGAIAIHCALCVVDNLLLIINPLLRLGKSLLRSVIYRGNAILFCFGLVQGFGYFRFPSNILSRFAEQLIGAGLCFISVRLC